MERTQFNRATLLHIVDAIDGPVTTGTAVQIFNLDKNLQMSSRFDNLTDTGFLKKTKVTKADRDNYSLDTATQWKYSLTPKGRKELKNTRDKVLSDEEISMIRKKPKGGPGKIPNLSQASEEVMNSMAIMFNEHTQAVGLIKQIHGLCEQFLSTVKEPQGEEDDGEELDS